jgi:hypothetical protein
MEPILPRCLLHHITIFPPAPPLEPVPVDPIHHGDELHDLMADPPELRARQHMVAEPAVGLSDRGFELGHRGGEVVQQFVRRRT